MGALPLRSHPIPVASFHPAMLCFPVAAVAARRARLPEVDLEFLGRQVALVLEGQREIKADIGTLKADMVVVKAALAETATCDLMLRMLRSFEGQV